MLSQVNCTGRVMVVINNGGGKIFSEVPRLEKMSESGKAWMKAETPVDFSAIAKAWGMDFQKVARADEFDGVESSLRTTLLEVIPS